MTDKPGAAPATLPLLILFVLVFTLMGCGGDEDSASDSTGSTATTEPSDTSSTATSISESPTTASTNSTVSTTTSTTATTTTTSESPDSSTATTEPSITVMFVCGNGEDGSAEFGTDDIEEIDDIVNSTDLCEFRDGLIEISFTAPCPSGDREVTVAATDGAIPDIASLDLCENP